MDAMETREYTTMCRVFDTYTGRDKTFRTVQNAARLISGAGVLGDERTRQLDVVDKELSFLRRGMLLTSLPAAARAAKRVVADLVAQLAAGHTPSVARVLGAVKAVAFAAYLVCSHATWAHTVKLTQLADLAAHKRRELHLLAVVYIASLVADLHRLFVTLPATKQRQDDAVAETRLNAAKNAADLACAGASLSWWSVSRTNVGALGLFTSVVSLRALFADAYGQSS